MNCVRVHVLLLCRSVFKRVGFNAIVRFRSDVLCDVVWFVWLLPFFACVCVNCLFNVLGCCV